MSEGIAPPRPRFAGFLLSTLLATLVVLLAGLLIPPAAHATFHLIDISEVYTNADGSVQFVELRALAGSQTQLTGTRLVAHNADSTSSVILFNFSASFPALGDGETLLLATSAFQDSAGFAPDFVMADSVFFPDGRVCFDRDPPTLPVHVDAVAYGNYTGANSGGAYGSPAAPLPSDGAFSLTRATFFFLETSVKNNANDFVVVGNTPTRNDGMTTRLNYPASGVDPGLGRGSITLGQSRPNPMRDDARIDFALERDAVVTLVIHGVDGRLVRAVFAGRLGAGPHQILWDGLDGNGRPAAGGVYVYRLTADGESAAGRLHVVR